MQSVSSRIWTRVAVSISYDDNHYTTGTSILRSNFSVVNKSALSNSANLNSLYFSNVPVSLSTYDFEPLFFKKAFAISYLF